MEQKEFEKLTDEEKLKFYDSEIREVSEELDRASVPSYIQIPDFHRERKSEDIKRLERKIENLRSERQSFLERVKLGFSEQKQKKVSKQIFIAAWFHPSMNKNIEAVSKGILEAGFEPKCIKDEHFSERIMDKALGEIRLSRCVIVDLTGLRPSVFFEAGFAFGLETQSVYIYIKKIP